MSNDVEFPLLRAQGMYASNITGDGNCLFRALSDQFYGDSERHGSVRKDVVQFLKQHKTEFIGFLAAVSTGSSIGRVNRRRAITTVNYRQIGNGSKPTPETVQSKTNDDRAWEHYLATMSQDGVYGDNLEIVAFAKRFNVDVKIHLSDFAYVVSGETISKPDATRTLLHIAYHQWEHYSSIRNINGPHYGLPEVQEKLITRADSQSLLENHKYCQPWMEKIVYSSIPELSDDPKLVQDTIEKFKGDVNQAVEYLFEKQYEGFTSNEVTSPTINDKETTEGVIASSFQVQKNKQGLESLARSVSPPSEATDIVPIPSVIESARHPPRHSIRKQALDSSITKKQSHASSQAGSTKPKRKETARERKERQKRESKERRKSEHQQTQQINKDAEISIGSAASKVVYI
ncbi:hypothetical protein V1514DRAFT_327522 [Lipomyces japonicus]|uniref:uncharacterized protein n=1 Tax=Lipomyces japonicus TaxID=56871 RepID=UPI0034D0198A